MKTTLFASRRVWLTTLLSLVVVVAGCATKPRADWNSRVGTYTYDDAVKEMGPPDKSAKLTDGTLVAEWLTVRGYIGGTVYTYGGLGYRYYGGPVWQQYVYAPSPNRFLRLTFNPDGKLSKWQNVMR
jgi:hypothetical protein